MFDLHRHDLYSLFDGFNKPEEIAKRAYKIGYTALGITNHGSINGLVKHYFACKDAKIKPVLGVEAYFQPKFDKEKPRFHLCLVVKDVEGYRNLNRLMTIAERQKYYNPIVTFKDLEQYNKGLICSSACIAGFIPQLIYKNKLNLAEKVVKKFKDIFGEDFYLEIMPYKLEQKGLQENINIKLIEIAKRTGVECILTSDSHYCKIDDWETYLKMHEMKGTKYDIEKTYKEHYLPFPEDFAKRFIKMHKKDFVNTRVLAAKMYENIDKIEQEIDGDILEKLLLKLPEYREGKDSYNLLVKKVKKGLKERGVNNKKYIERCENELEIIKQHGFSDYFLMVADYVNWAKKQGIEVGPGRGSVCNSEVAYVLGITNVDSLYFGLDFRRFLRKDKTAIPDIDLDFQTSRREEVINYIIEKYKGHSAQICTYGLWKVDNLINDLVKVCGVEDEMEIKEIKQFIKENIEQGQFDYDKVKIKSKCKEYNRKYDNIIKHFSKLYLNVRYIGTHAAGVAITGGNILDYCAVREDKKTGRKFTVYDLEDLEKINVIKFDILGLNTLEQINELKKMTGKSYDKSWLEDRKIMSEFGKGNTDGVFQFEKNTAKNILQEIKCDCFEDVIAVNSMNRPGPLSMKMPEQYAENKFNVEEIEKEKYFKYTKETYGVIVYQEQLQQICVNIGKMSWQDADRVMKRLKKTSEQTAAGGETIEKEKKELMRKFIKGAKQNGYTKRKAKELFEKFFNYTFNKGHATGYSLISLQEMFYKIYYPTEYWFIKCKYALNDNDRYKYTAKASADGVIIFIPHVNYTADYCLRDVEGEKIIQEGLSSIKFVGKKAAEFIERERKNGKFKNYDDFVERCRVKGSGVNKRVIEQLLEHGALEFNKNIYIKRVKKYNTALYLKGQDKKW
jgi:DNA polymerase-3 subunit alpha